MRADCAPCCSEISDKHHAVILELAYGLTDTREKPQGLGEPLTQAQAWMRHYKAKPGAAKTNCSRMLTDADCAESLARHRMSKAERIEDDWVDLRGQLVATGRAKLYDFVVAQDPDSDSWARLKTILTDGVEVRDKATGEVKYREPTKKELRRAIDDAASLRMKRPEELSESARSVVTDFSYDPSRGIIRYKLERLAAIKQLSEVDGKRTINVDVRAAEAMNAAVYSRLEARVRPALEAVAGPVPTPDAQAFVRARARELAEDQSLSAEVRSAMAGLGESATGTVDEVLAVVVG